MDDELIQKLKDQEYKISSIYHDIKTIKKIFIITMIINVVFLVLPLIGLLFAIPMLLNTYESLYSGLGI